MAPQQIVEIVPLTAPLIPQATELLLQQLADHEIPAKAEAVAQALSASLGSEDGFVLLWIEAGRALGVAFVSYARPLEHAGEVAFLEELYVVPERRGGGIGTALLAEVRRRAEARGCVSLDLEVDDRHPRAAAMYLRMGFRDTRRKHLKLPLSNWDW